jgi:hypothetical protein
VQRLDGAAHDLMRILPADRRFDGFLITFANVIRIVLAEKYQRLPVDAPNNRVKNMLTAVISLATNTL